MKVESVLAAICDQYSVTDDWLYQFVICPGDVEDIRTGDLPLPCLRAHVEYHLADQKAWEKRKQEIFKEARQ